MESQHHFFKDSPAFYKMGIQHGYATFTKYGLVSITDHNEVYTGSHLDSQSFSPIFNSNFTDGFEEPIEHLFIDFNSLKKYVRENKIDDIIDFPRFNCKFTDDVLAVLDKNKIDVRIKQVNELHDRLLLNKELPEKNEKYSYLWVIFLYKLELYLKYLIKVLKPRKSVFVSFEGKKYFSQFFSTKIYNTKKYMIDIIKKERPRNKDDTSEDLSAMDIDRFKSLALDGNYGIFNHYNLNTIKFKEFIGRNLQLLFSNHEIRVEFNYDREFIGQGEFKIFQKIRELPAEDKNIAIYCRDSDMIELSLTENCNRNIYLLKEKRDHKPFLSNHYIESRNRILRNSFVDYTNITYSNGEISENIFHAPLRQSNDLSKKYININYGPEFRKVFKEQFSEQFFLFSHRRFYFLKIRNVAKCLVTKVKQSITMKLRNPKKQYNIMPEEFPYVKLNSDRVVEDILVFSFILGNDFIRPLPGLICGKNIKLSEYTEVESFDYMITIYAEILIEYFLLEIEDYVKKYGNFFKKYDFYQTVKLTYLYDREKQIKMEFLKYFLYYLSRFDEKTLQKESHELMEIYKAQLEDTHIENLNNKWNLIPTNPLFPDCKYKWDNLPEGFQPRKNLNSFYPIKYDTFASGLNFYRNTFFHVNYDQIDEINAICRNYIEGIIYCTRLYFNGDCNNGFYYRYVAPPLLSDLAYYIWNKKNLIDYSVKVNLGPMPNLKYFEYLLLTINYHEFDYFDFKPFTIELTKIIDNDRSKIKEERRFDDIYPDIEKVHFLTAGKFLINDIVPDIVPPDIEIIRKLYRTVTDNVRRNYEGEWDVFDEVNF